MNKTILLITAIFIFTTTNFSQSIKINIKNTSSNRAELYSVSGEKLSFIDSIFSGTPGSFIYEIKNLSNGFYKLTFDNHKSITFLYDDEDIEINADAENILESAKVLSSRSNELYYRFVKLNREYKAKTELLQLILARYPQDDDYFDLTKAKLLELQNEYLTFVNVTSQKEPGSFIARYIKSSQLAVLSIASLIDDQLAYLKKQSLDNIDFTDDDLINSDCFTNKSIEYLTYYRNPQLPMSLLEQEFKKAVDTLLTKASVNIFVYQQVADYLVAGFKHFGFDNVVDYIIENFVVKDELCLDEQIENSIQNRINQSKLLAAGTTAPNIILLDENGDELNLATIEAERILLIFYASWCPHCKDLLPEIHKLYKEKSNFEVVAISLDEKKEDWISFISENNLDWINVSDLKSWGSKAVQDYFIYATPTMFLLTSSRKIIGNPITINELHSLL